MRSIILALAILFGIGAALPEPPIYVTRHYDTPAGERDPDLLPVGKARAEKLAQALKGKSIARIFVSDFKRTRQTAAPLAASGSIPLEIYDPNDTPTIINRARSVKAPVLIVGHSNTVPDQVEQLGGKRPGDLKHEDFGDLWTVRNGAATHSRIEP